MRIPRTCIGGAGGLLFLMTLLLGGCTGHTTSPVEAPVIPDRRLQLAWDGETGVRILIDGQSLADSAKAARLRVEVVPDAGRPTFLGNTSNKTVQLGHVPTQPMIVDYCRLGVDCEGVHVSFHDQFGGLPGQLKANQGILADGDYTVKLWRGSTLVSSKAIAVNHGNFTPNNGNGSFLDEVGQDQIITFYLNSSLSQIGAPQVDFPHTRASTHLAGSITRPGASDTTINVGQSLSVRGSASNGLNGNGKKYAWDWDATGTNHETFDTEFSTSNTAAHTYDTPGDYRIRLIVRDGNDIFNVAPYGGHYAVSATKMVHVVDFVPVASVEVSPANATIDDGGIVTLDAIMRDAFGNILTGRIVTWQTSNASIVTVPSSGDPVVATGQGPGTATITATSEGIEGYASITVNQPTGIDDAAAAGNTLPFEINNGDFVSVTVSMQNTGTSTWSSEDYYQLIVSQGGQYWWPGVAFLTSSVGAGYTRDFAFDLGLDDPFHTGNTACFWQMDHAGDFFGEENGRMIYVYESSGMSAMGAGAQEGGDILEEVADPERWMVGARETDPARFGPGTGQLSSGEAQLLTYRYNHEIPRTIDVVFKIVVDPAVAQVLPPRIDTDGTKLRWRIASGDPGEHWVRLTGTLPAGTGTIGAFPVQVLPGKTASGELGTVTLYYPPN